MTSLEQIVEQLHQRHKRLLVEMQKLREALEILDPPAPIKARPAEEQIEDVILNGVRRGPKTRSQLAKMADTSIYRVTRIGDALVESGTLEIENISGVVHYRVKREHLKIVAGEGALQ